MGYKRANEFMKKVILSLLILGFGFTSSSMLQAQPSQTEYAMASSAGDTKYGDVNAWTQYKNTMRLSVYESPYSCGDYYVLYQGEKYRVRSNPDYREDISNGNPIVTKKYMVEIDGTKWYFDL